MHCYCCTRARTAQFGTTTIALSLSGSDKRQEANLYYDKLKLYKQWHNDNNKLQATVHLFVTTATISADAATISADEVCINRNEPFGLINFLDTLCRENIVVYLIKSRLETNSWH